MKQKALLPMMAAALLALPLSVLAETVNWSLTVAAEETYPVTQIQTTDLWASFAAQGSLGGVVPPSGTVSFTANITLVEPGFADYPVQFSGLPNAHPKYAVWFGSIGGNWHRVILFGGSVGGTVLGIHEFQCHEHGYHNMHVVFAWTQAFTVIRTISATDSGSLVGGLGESKQAAWSAVPNATPGSSVGAYRYTLSGSNPAVVLSHSVDASGTAGLITAKFPSCVASTEVCDGIDNDCNGLVDEAFQPITCGLGICRNTVNSCSGGVAMTCDPMQGSSVEACDGIDNDCNGVVDNGCTALDFAPALITSLVGDPQTSPQDSKKLQQAGGLLAEAKNAFGSGNLARWSKSIEKALDIIEDVCKSQSSTSCSDVMRDLAAYAYATGSAEVERLAGNASDLKKIEDARISLSEAWDKLQDGDYNSAVDKVNDAVKKALSAVK